ncbi:carboxypeptidase-like regulatory domain-containing protein [Olleya marilimosa]|uniref:carboxypeptidase-like regulatory domain-containing protein n=1 Tax=Olleya marilimosa TaxID=272164 RepID=UPI0004850725|nr:carboxypeptidase-like regulatory domain-containing protein [Olleya marilimosa]
MRTIFYLFIAFQLFSSKAFSQEIVMNGIVIDSENQEPIEFVNIGVQHKNQGTITNPNGEFNLKLPKEYKTDSITISHINYYSIKILAQNLKNQTIFLEPKTTELSEVIVSNKKIKNRKIGVKSYNRLLSTRVTSKSTDIIELAQLIKVPTEEAKVKAVNFNIRKWSEVDGVKVRINFYENVDNYPSKKIIQKNIIQEIPTERESDWIRIDLNNNDIYITQDFFIGIEFIPNFNNPTIVDLGGILTKGKGYRRESSLGTWEKLNGGASINVEIAY